MAGITPVSIITGSSPTTAKLWKRARGRSPSRSAACGETISTAAAPSLIWEELPAVTTQPIWGKRSE